MHDVAQTQHQLIATEVGQADIADNDIVATCTTAAADHHDSFGTLLGCLDNAAVSFQQLMRIFTNLLIGIHNENAFITKRRMLG